VLAACGGEAADPPAGAGAEHSQAAGAVGPLTPPPTVPPSEASPAGGGGAAEASDPVSTGGAAATPAPGVAVEADDATTSAAGEGVAGSTGAVVPEPTPRGAGVSADEADVSGMPPAPSEPAGLDAASASAGTADEPRIAAPGPGRLEAARLRAGAVRDRIQGELPGLACEAVPRMEREIQALDAALSAAITPDGEPASDARVRELEQATARAEAALDDWL
jgi:hypothetical protein